MNKTKRIDQMEPEELAKNLVEPCTDYLPDDHAFWFVKTLAEAIKTDRAQTEARVRRECFNQVQDMISKAAQIILNHHRPRR